MKKLLVLFALFAFVAVSCEKEPVLVLSADSICVPSSGESSIITVNANNPWSVQGNDWCSVTPSEGDGGEVMVTVSVKENTTYDPRSCTLAFLSAGLTQLLEVTQESNLGIVVPDNTYELSSAAQQISVEVKANVEYDITIGSDWIKESGTKSLTSKIYIFDVLANSTYGPRECTIAIKEKNGPNIINVKVLQAQNDAIVISEKEYSLSSEAQSLEVKLQTNVDIEVITPAWISHTSTRALSDKILVLDVSANEGYGSRSGNVIVRNKNTALADTVKIRQAQKDAIILSQKEYELDCSKHVLEISLQTNVGIEVEVPEEVAGWIAHIQTKSMEDKTLVIEVDANETYGERSGEIYVKNISCGLQEPIKITQLQNDAILLVKKEYEVSSEAQQLNVSLKTNVDIEVSVLEQAREWISHIQTKTLEDKTIIFEIKTNEGYENRTGKVLVKDKKSSLSDTLAITQLQKDAVILSRTEYVVSSKAQVLEIKVQTNGKMGVEIPEAAQEWVSYVNTKAMVEKVIVLDIAENKTYGERECEIGIINEATSVRSAVKIIQMQNDALVISDKTFNVGSKGGNIEVTVDHNVDYDVIIEDNWISQVKTKALEREKVNFAISENPSTESRTGTVAFVSEDGTLSQKITVLQEGKSYHIYYTSSDGGIVVPKVSTWGEAQILSNKYENGQGVIVFDREVTVMPYNAFIDCSTLTSITLPESMMEIGKNTFRGCKGMTRFKGKFASQDGRCLVVGGELKAFAPYGLASYSIPEGVTSIYSDVEWCNLKSVTIPDSMTDIGYEAFRTCVTIEEFKGKFAADNGRCLIIDDELVAFACGCGLQKYTIPANVVSIGNCAFEECSLTEVNVHEGVTDIGRYVFRGSKNLKVVTISENVAKIGEQAFYYCSNLSKVYCKVQTPPLMSPPSTPWNFFSDYASDFKIYVPVKSVATYKAADYWKDYEDKIAGYDFENGTEAQPYNEIWYTSSDGKVITPRSVDFNTTIKSNIYENGKGVITFDDDVTRIGEEAFRLKSKLTSISLPNSVVTIAYEAFCYCSGLTGDMTIPESVSKIEERAFMGCNISSFKGKFASSDGRLLVVANEAVAFAPKGIESYTFPAGVTKLGDWLIYGCHGLKSLVIPSTVKSIGEYAVYNCSKLEDVRIGTGVESIGMEFCWGCPSLRYATVPANVKSMGFNCFGSCSLEYLKFDSSEPPGYNFLPQSNDYFVYVPSGAYNAYCNGCPSYMKDRFVVYTNIMEKCKTQPNNQLWYFSSEPVYPGDANKIDAEVTGSSCSGGNGVLKFSNAVTTIGKFAFDDNIDLRAVFIPEGVKTIGLQAFEGCSYISVIVLPESIEEIGAMAFHNYSCKHIGLYCKAVTPPKLGESVLYKSDNTNHRIYVPRGSVAAYKAADGWKEFADQIVGYDF